MAKPKIAFRIWPDAQDKLFDEVKRYKGDQPPVGQFVSRLFFDVPARVVGGSAGVNGSKYEEWKP
jgi:hypothetical protein